MLLIQKFRIQLVPPLLGLVAVGLLLTVVSGCNSARMQPLVIATAANAQFAMEALTREFEKISDVSTELIISSSGKHTAQIEAGAPYDIFVSADLKYPQRLFDLNLTTATPKIYAYGKLVLWSVSKPDLVHSDSITSTSVKYVAMPNPETAPYGIAAKEYLLNANKYAVIQEKLVYGESVAQTNQYILTGSAELGFTAAAIVMAPPYRNKGKWIELDNANYTPIAQGAVIIKSTSQPENAMSFYSFMFSEQGQSILAEFGYNKVATE